MSVESDAVKTVAGLMALAARTAPKAVGLDSITIEIVSDEVQARIADKMIEIGQNTGMDFFKINGEQVKNSDATVLIGVKGIAGLGLNCGGCGFTTCKEMMKNSETNPSVDSDYHGPNCVFKVSDLGIAVGSAVKTASIHNVDNRVMYSAGVAAMKLGMMDRCSIVFGIPLKASGKNLYFATAIEH
jgi:uncharacterized ferredoxin-like protein